MKIINLTEHSDTYTSNAFLVLGTWNALGDVNTLVDVGRDANLIGAIGKISTGVAKKPVEQVILTHNHYDHTGCLGLVMDAFQPAVYAYSRSVKVSHHILKDGDMLKLGDSMFEVIHAPCHSSDSICLYSEEEGVLFVGDTPLLVHDSSSTYENDFVRIVERLSRKDVRSIYFGHGPPRMKGCKDAIARSLKNIQKNKGSHT